MRQQKHIIFIPGKNPKPPCSQHKQQLWRCMLEGINRAAPSMHPPKEHQFHLINWNHIFYNKDKDISIDLPWIDKLIHTHAPGELDIRLANHWHIRFARFLYNVIDQFHFLVPFIPNQKIKQNILETDRYFHNLDNIANQIRSYTKSTIIPLLEQKHKLLIVGHSMGSIIAYDTLWELSHIEKLAFKVDFLSMGSPLGVRLIQKHLRGFQESGRRRYPLNIRNWYNISAVGDLTSLDVELCDDFTEMIQLGLVNNIEDHCHDIYNYFRNHEGLNVHRSYGYLVNPATGMLIANWLSQD